MFYPHPLVTGQLLRRYKRFLADVRLDDGAEVTAHCANPGSMMGLAEPGLAVRLSRSDDPKRKLAWSLEQVLTGPGTVGVNTGRANAVVGEALINGQVPALAGYDKVQREVRFGEKSRLDFFLTGSGLPDCFVEVKSVTLKRDGAGAGLAEFPDAKTARGARHLEELERIAGSGMRAVLFFLVQRDDCARCGIADDIDPAYAAAFDSAQRAGVDVIAHACNLSETELTLAGPLPLALRDAT